MESLGIAAANFAMESELLLNGAGALYFFTLYYCVQKRARFSSLQKWLWRLLEQNWESAKIV